MQRLCRYIVLSARPDEYASFSLLDFYARVLPRPSHTLRHTHTHTHTHTHVQEAPLGNNTHLHAYNAVWIAVHVNCWHHITHVAVCIAVIPWLLLLLINLLLISLLWLCKIFVRDENAVVITVMLNTPLLTSASYPPVSKLKASPTVWRTKISFKNKETQQAQWQY